MLESIEQKMVKAYIHIDFLKRGTNNLKKEVAELKGTRKTLKEELRIARKKV